MMDQVKCRVEIPNVEGLKPAEMTVGRHALLSCEGDWNKSFDFTQAKIKLDDSQKYLIKVLKAEARSATAFDADVTLYVAGRIKPAEFILTDGVNEISLGAQSFDVQSVLEQPAQGQPAQKPFGFLFPIALVWPTIYFVLLFAVLALALTALLVKLRQAAKVAKMVSDLHQHNSPLAPELQFYKSMRASEKESYPLESIENAFRLYVLRTFQVPMFVLDRAQIGQYFKKRKKAFKVERTQVDRILGEFDEIRKSKKPLSLSEKQELVRKMNRFVDRVQQSQPSFGTFGDSQTGGAR